MITPSAIYSPAVAEIDLLRLVRCIEAAESGGKWNQPGGALQYVPKTWAEETRLPYILAQKQDVAEGIAVARLVRIQALSRRFGVTVTVRLLAESWRFGCAGAMKRQKTGKLSSYGTRVQNLYDEHMAQH